MVGLASTLDPPYKTCTFICVGLATDFGGQSAAGEATYGLPPPGGAELGRLAGEP
jgi:hypothetical protein